jgi:hypothetical protein
MYKLTDTSVEFSFMKSKIGLKSFIVSLFSIQFIFHIFASIYIQIISYFQLDLHLYVLNPRLLSSFALDTWLIVFLVSFFVLGYSILKTVKDYPLYILTVYPAMLILLSLVRDVSLFQTIIFLFLSFIIVIQSSYQKVKQLDYSQV